MPRIEHEHEAGQAQPPRKQRGTDPRGQQSTDREGDEPDVHLKTLSEQRV